MKIGIIGAPGAQKSEFAKALAEEFGLTVVDNYVQKLQDETGLALGPWSSYPEHFMVAGVRRAAELRHEERITVGTIFDSLTYAVIHADVMMHKTVEHRRHMYETAQVAIQGLTMWSEGAFDYDISFFLPFTREQIEEQGVVWQTTLNSAYPLVLETLFAEQVYKLEGTFEERLEIAKEAVKLVQDATTETD